MGVLESLATAISCSGPQGYGTVRVALYRASRVRLTDLSCLPRLEALRWS